MENTSLRVAVIIGSTRNGRFGPRVTDWFVARAHRRRELELDVVDLAAVRLPATLTDNDEPAPAAVAELAPRLAAADAFVVVTPEYNQSFPASVKTCIDWYGAEWAAKPVAVVAYGRDSGGVLAISQLRQVFAEVGAVVIRDCVSVPCFWELFDVDGHWPKPNRRLEDTVATLLTQLTWWADALHDARTRTPIFT